MMAALRSFAFAFAILTTLAAIGSQAATNVEPYRPQFHFTPEKNWLNDPNGLVYYVGEYHLFFQYNPYGINSANKSWGHAVSRDLTRWEELPVAIPAANGIEIFSGSALVDWNNTSGFQTGSEPPMIAIYTGHRSGRQDQRIAYSNDRGRTWTDYAQNPVLDIGLADFRDPKVFWHQPSNAWIMAVVLATQQKARFYKSANLKNWTQLSEFGPAGSTNGAWECPNLVQVPVADGGGTKKWVFSVGVGGAPSGGTGVQYFVGNFDGTRFTDDNATSQSPLPADTVMLNDFEGSGYGAWTTTGTAFGNGPAQGALANQQSVSGYRGVGLVNTYLGGDGATGTLLSPEFIINRARLNFLIGGGGLAGNTCVNLLVNGQIVRTATGDNNERLNWKNWNVSEFLGTVARVQIVDSATGGWGHVNVDDIFLSDSAIAPEIYTQLWMDYGPDDYAAVSWSDIPDADGRTLWIGWMVDLRYCTVIPTTPWRGNMTLPRELTLRPTPAGLRMAQNPVAELASAHAATRLSHSGGTLDELNAFLDGQTVPTLFDCTVELDVPAGVNAGVNVGTVSEYTRVTWDRANSQLTVDRTHSGVTNFHSGFSSAYSAPVVISGNRMKLRLVLDSGSLEVFGFDGTSTLTSLIFPTAKTRGLSFFGAGAQVVYFDLWPMASIHPAPASLLLGSRNFNETALGSFADGSGNGNTLVSSGTVASGPGFNAAVAEVRRTAAGVVGSLRVPAADLLMPDSFTVSYFSQP